MEDNRLASVEINLEAKKILIQGSEEFVEKNMQSVFSFVGKIAKVGDDFSKSDNAGQGNLKSDTNTSDVRDNCTDAHIEKCISAGVIHVDPEDGGISILKRIPGNNKAEKAKKNTVFAVS